VYGIRNEVSFVIPTLQPSHKKKKEAAATQLLAPTLLSCALLCCAGYCGRGRGGLAYGMVSFYSQLATFAQGKGRREAADFTKTNAKQQQTGQRRHSGTLAGGGELVQQHRRLVKKKVFARPGV